MNKYTIAYAPDDKYMNMTVVSMVSALENKKNSEVKTENKPESEKAKEAK